MRAPHKQVHTVCPWGVTTWGACDKAADAAKADWDAMQQVLLAYKLAMRGDLRAWRKDHSVFPQLVLYVAGEYRAILNKEGNPSQSVEVLRLMSAIERVKAGDLPAYNLYTLATSA